jgi:hypothetical protein
MNKYQEAIEQIEMIKKFIGYDKDSIMVKRIFKALDLAISALEKQMANEPVTEGVYGALYDACPVCGQAVDYCAFCPTCGQKLVEVSP